MIAADILGAFAVLLIAAATPRQAGLLLGPRLDRRHRSMVRVTGMVALGLSFVLTLTMDDTARRVIGWIGLVGLEALAAALLFTLMFVRQHGR
jgi:hypothetical protein